VVTVGALLVLLACAGCAATPATSGAPGGPGNPPAVAPVLPSTPQPAADAPPTSAPTSTPASAPGTTVDRVVDAAGVQQWVRCAGAGPVTVVVVTGLNASAGAWSDVSPAMQRITRTCVYDRPGLGRSPARPQAGQVVDAGLYAHELAALLAAVGEVGPFVVVGHSFGGLIARAFVHLYPRHVRALLLVESVTPNDPTTDPFWEEAGHKVDMAASSAATGDGPPLGHLPLLVLSASDPEEDHLGGPTYGQPEELVDLWREQQRDDLELSTDAIQVVAHSGHVVQQDNPAAVVDAVRQLVAAVTSGRPLRCTPGWSADAATCR